MRGVQPERIPPKVTSELAWLKESEDLSPENSAEGDLQVDTDFQETLQAWHTGPARCRREEDLSSSEGCTNESGTSQPTGGARDVELQSFDPAATGSDTTAASKRHASDRLKRLYRVWPARK